MKNLPPIIVGFCALLIVGCMTSAPLSRHVSSRTVDYPSGFLETGFGTKTVVRATIKLSPPGEAFLVVKGHDPYRAGTSDENFFSESVSVETAKRFLSDIERSLKRFRFSSVSEPSFFTTSWTKISLTRGDNTLEATYGNVAQQPVPDTMGPFREFVIARMKTHGIK